MNVIDAWVIEIQGEPYYKYNKWCVRVKSEDMGGITNDTLMFDIKEEAERVQIGYKFLH